MKTIYHDTYRELIDELIKLRKRANLTQTQVAEKLHKPQSYIAKIENFERKLDILEFVQLCRVIDVKASELIVLIE